MAHICPFWLGYFLINPLRKFLENPDKMLSPYVSGGMTVLEPGCGMGFFTLPLARMVGTEGKVVVVDIQEKMLSALKKRAQRAGLADRITFRHAGNDGLGLDDLVNKIDFAVAIHVVHEIPDQTAFFKEMWKALKPGKKLLVVEPKGHVSGDKFEVSMEKAREIGFRTEPMDMKPGERKALLMKDESL